MVNEKIIDRVKALLAKTVQNGCSEDEAFSAAKKAQEIMDQYDIDNTDLVEKSEFVQFLRGGVKADIMKRRLMAAVAKYCGCYVVLLHTGAAQVTGRDVDIVMAEWLYDSLDRYLTRELKSHMSGHHKDPGAEKTNRKNGFIVGACNRIADRLEEMTKVRSEQSNALVVSRQQESKGAYLALNEGAKIRAGRASTINVSQESMKDGAAAGDRANFSRPICSNSKTSLLS
jgi:hypothetical protein